MYLSDCASGPLSIDASLEEHLWQFSQLEFKQCTSRHTFQSEKASVAGNRGSLLAACLRGGLGSPLYLRSRATFPCWAANCSVWHDALLAGRDSVLVGLKAIYRSSH